MMRPFDNPAVADAYDALPPDVRDMALTLRDLILSVAWDTPQVGRIEETLKWGQPSYLTSETKSGSTLRIGMAKNGGAALFAHCATNIISTYANTFPEADQIEGNRAVIFMRAQDIVPERVRLLIYHGLTYHLKQARAS
ncbi:DUF1801 domain-containing protein [Loktanella agnita]|uniref:DUF1801 domain-containing protein n=1 Tax=Loktanella agnita TaxID=287097 RepID=UPI00398777EF